MATNTLTHAGPYDPGMVSPIAAAGTTQATATPLAGNYALVEILTCASGAGVLLPIPRPPASVTIFNGSANACLIYPRPGASINNGSVNAAYSLPAGVSIEFRAPALNNWYPLALSGVTGGTGSPGGATGTLQANNGSGGFGGVPAMNGDATFNTTTGAIDVVSTGGVAFGSLAVASAAPAGTLTGTTLNATVVTSSLTAVGVIATGAWQGTIVAPAYGGTGVANASTITIGGNVAFAGAHTFTATLTNNTAVTFPTTGTLSTLGQVFAFGLAPGTTLSAGTNLFGTSVAAQAKTLTGYSIYLGTNPSGGGGGATIDIWKNGSSILSAPVAVAAGTTTVTTGVPTTTAVAAGDLLTVNTSSVGTSVSNVKILAY